MLTQNRDETKAGREKKINRSEEEEESDEEWTEKYEMRLNIINRPFTCQFPSSFSSSFFSFLLLFLLPHGAGRMRRMQSKLASERDREIECSR